MRPTANGAPFLVWGRMEAEVNGLRQIGGLRKEISDAMVGMVDAMPSSVVWWRRSMVLGRSVVWRRRYQMQWERASGIFFLFNTELFVFLFFLVLVFFFCFVLLNMVVRCLTWWCLFVFIFYFFWYCFFIFYNIVLTWKFVEVSKSLFFITLCWRGNL